VGRPTKPRTVFPYFKVHVFDQTKMAWEDARKKAFDTLREAQEFVRRLPRSKRVRILVVTGRRARHVYQDG
jgi:6-phosphogluconate dehydrogenase (decarboxylating)